MKPTITQTLTAILVACFAWPLMFILRVTLILMGLIIVPIGLYFYKRNGTWPRSIWLWFNDEDGVGPTWYNKEGGYADQKGYGAWYRKFHWLAIRNPANNMRYFDGTDADINKPPAYVFWLGDYDVENALREPRGFQWQFVWLKRGWKIFPAFWLMWPRKSARKHLRIRIGWKVVPSDADGANDYRKDGAGFATQLMWRDG